MIGALTFLLRFVIATSLGMGLWLWWAPAYLELVMPAVNALAAWFDMPLRLMQEGEHVLYQYRPPGGSWFRLLATGQESIHLNIVVMGAVFAATPGRCGLWRLRWVAVALGLLWVSHVLSFYLGGQVAIWQFANSGAHAASLAQQVAPWIPANRSQWLLQILEAWNLWGRYGLCVLLWITARAQPVVARQAVEAGFTWRIDRLVLRPTAA